MYHQVLRIGDDAVPVVIEYSEDECGPFVIEKITIINGPVVPVGIFDEGAIWDMSERLALGHDRVLAELAAEYRADRAQEQDSFRAAYGD